MHVIGVWGNRITPILINKPYKVDFFFLINISIYHKNPKKIVIIEG